MSVDDVTEQEPKLIYQELSCEILENKVLKNLLDSKDLLNLDEIRFKNPPPASEATQLPNQCRKDTIRIPKNSKVYTVRIPPYSNPLALNSLVKDR